MRFVTKQLQLARLGVGIVVTTVGALSVHSVMLQTLHVPFPDLSAISSGYKFVIRVLATLGLLLFWQLSSQNLPRSFIKQSAIVFLFSAMLTENLFRGPFMNAYCTNAWTFTFVASIQKLLSMALAALMIVAATRRLPRFWQKLAGALAITAVTAFVLGPLIAKLIEPAMAALAHLAPQGEWCALPYGANVLIPAYLTFLEPVLACVAGAALVWDRLPPSRGLRFLQFTLLILVIKNQLITPIVYATLAKIPFLTGLASEGQFAMEAVALALLTGLTWEWSTSRST
jgi:hypothetical protein